jgi:hypothetical protein
MGIRLSGPFDAKIEVIGREVKPFRSISAKANKQRGV